MRDPHFHLVDCAGRIERRRLPHHFDRMFRRVRPHLLAVFGGEKNLLLGILNGGMPELPISGDLNPETLALIKQMAALHKRVALLEMTNHEFLDQNRRKERSTFSDGTTVTVDWDVNTVTIKPDLL